MRWFLLAAAALVAALLLFLLRDEEPRSRETHAPDVPLSKEDYWRKQGEIHGEAADPDSTGAETTPANVDPRTNAAWLRRAVDLAMERARRPVIVDVEVEVRYADGTPADGASVGHTWNPVYAVDAVDTKTTDENGIARLRLTIQVRGGPRWFFARRGSLTSERRVGISDNQRIQLVLKPGGFVIRGIVLNPDETLAQSDVTVSVNYWDGWEWRFQQGNAKNGRFECLPVPRAWIKRMHIYVMQKGMPRNLFQWPKAVTDLTLQLTSETVRGRVVRENGAPAANVQVNTGERALRTDKDGRFETAFQRREGALLRVNKMVRVLKANDRDIEIVLKPGRPLQGQLLTHDRKPVVAAWVRLSMPVGGGLASSGTDRDGRFQFLALAEGPHILRFEMRAGLAAVPIYFVKDVHATDRLLEVVLPKPIAGRLRLRGEDGRVPTLAKRVTLAVERDGRQIYKHTWPQGKAMDTLPFTVWEAGGYSLLVATASHDPARLRSIRISATGPNVFDLTLKKKLRVR